MWFKNIQLYRFHSDFKLSADELETALEKNRIRPCSQLERHTFGWTAPLGMGHDALMHVANGCYMFAAAKCEKVLPPSVVREQAEVQMLQQEEIEGRPLGRRERRSIIDEVTLELLPKAFSKTGVTYVYYDSKNNWLLIDTTSQKKADEITILLRDSVGSLPALLPQTETSVMYQLTQWLAHDNCPSGFSIDDFCELQKPDKEKSIIKCQQHDVTNERIRAHVDEGMQVTKLGMTWNDRLSFVIEQDFSIKRIRFLDLVQEQKADLEIESPEEQFTADFSIFAAEFAAFIPELAQCFGGFAEQAFVDNKMPALA